MSTQERMLLECGYYSDADKRKCHDENRFRVVR